MTARKITQIQQLYDSIQQRFLIVIDFEKLSGLTQFASNDALPVHRWFHFKEGFSANLLGAIEINEKVLKDKNTIFVDPFSGSGTTILAGDIQYQWEAKRIGFEINPFLAFVSSTKSGWRRYDVTKLQELIDSILKTPLRKDLSVNDFPGLSTFRNPKMFQRQKVSQLVDALSRIEKVEGLERDLLLLGIASAAEKIGFYRKDGRALRILRNKKEIRRRKALKVEDVLRSIWNDYEQDILTLKLQQRSHASKFEIICSDGRTMSSKEKKLKNQSVSLIAYSPPYLNHIDYTEVYKIELWLLGFVKTAEQMMALRKNTLRSHGSYYFESQGRQLPEQVRTVLNILSDEVEKADTVWHKRFRHVAFGYFEDMLISLRRQYELLRPGCKSICVVANSAHGSKDHRIPVATDLLIAVLAQEVGFEITGISVARRISRRDTLNLYLRESVVAMKKPEE